MLESNPPQLSGEQKSKLAQRLSLPNRSDDRGECPPELLVFKPGHTPSWSVARQQAELASVLRGDIRLLLPAWPHKGADGDCEDEDLGTVEVSPGRIATMVFSDLEALADFDRSARPVPSSSRRIAVNVSAGNGRLVLNPGPAQIVLPSPAVNAVAAGDSWLPPWEDSQLRDVLASLSGECGLGGINIQAQADGSQKLEVEVCRAQSAREDVGIFARALQGNQLVLTRCDSLQIYPVMK